MLCDTVPRPCTHMVVTGGAQTRREGGRGARAVHQAAGRRHGLFAELPPATADWSDTGCVCVWGGGGASRDPVCERRCVVT